MAPNPSDGQRPTGTVKARGCLDWVPPSSNKPLEGNVNPKRGVLGFGNFRIVYVTARVSQYKVFVLRNVLSHRIGVL